jgi:glutathionyl-hydroquinone reductase
VSSATSIRDPEAAVDGSFRRQVSQFRRWVSGDRDSEFQAEPGRYHLYVARACPWAHRTIIARHLIGLEDAIGMSFVDPIRDDRGWAFTGGEYIDQVNGMHYLSEAYLATDPAYAARVTVPVLWDTQTGQIVSNESAGHPADAAHRIRRTGRASGRALSRVAMR